jgi:hypothetical protein
MNVMSPDTKIDVLHFLSVLLISKKKKTAAAIMAMQPIKKVNAT